MYLCSKTKEKQKETNTILPSVVTKGLTINRMTPSKYFTKKEKSKIDILILPGSIRKVQ